MKSLFTKSLVSSGLIVVSLALNGGAAMAANLPVHKTAATARVSHALPAVRAAARGRQVPAQPGFDIGQLIQGMLGGPLPPQYAQIVRNGQKESASRRSSGSYGYSPSYDNSPTIDTSSAANDAQAASDEENQAIQQMNDTNALNASMAAAEQQNEAANAATLQTEINAGF